MPSINRLLEIGKGRIIKEGKKVAILNFGTRLTECKKSFRHIIKKWDRYYDYRCKIC